MNTTKPNDSAMSELLQKMVAGKQLSVSDAAQLAEDIGAQWLVPMHYETGQESDFVTHMLGQRPHQQFKVFELGEKWTVPVD